MDKILVDNVHGVNKCPLCGFAYNIVNNGNIIYENPINFSTEIIKITTAPQLHRCKNCKGGFTQYSIPEREAIKLYTEGDGTKRWTSESIALDKTPEVVDYLSKVFVKNKKIIDIGANTGELLDFAKSRGCITYAIEYSETSKDLLRAKGHHVINSIENFTDEFDIICAFDLIEHLYNVPKFLSDCYSKLKKNGELILLTGNINSMPANLAKNRWWYVSYPEHVIFISKKYLNNYTPFRIKKCIYTFANNAHKNASLKYSFLHFIKDILKNQFSGLPSLKPDHFLLALEKKIL